MLQAIQKEAATKEAKQVVEHVWLIYNTRIQNVVESNVTYEGLGTKLILMEIRPDRATNRNAVPSDQYVYPQEEIDAYTATLRALRAHLPGKTEVLSKDELVQLLESQGDADEIKVLENWPNADFPQGAFATSYPKRVVLETVIPNIRIAVEDGIDPRYPEINILCKFEDKDFSPLTKVTIIPSTTANIKWKYNPSAFSDLVGANIISYRSEQKAKIKEQQSAYLANNPKSGDRQKEASFNRLPTLQLRNNNFQIIPPIPKDLKVFESMLEASNLIEECLLILDTEMTLKGVNVYDFCQYTAVRNILAMTPDEIIADEPALTEIMGYARKYSTGNLRLQEIHAKANLAWEIPLTNQRENRHSQAIPPKS